MKIKKFESYSEFHGYSDENSDYDKYSKLKIKLEVFKSDNLSLDQTIEEIYKIFGEDLPEFN